MASAFLLTKWRNTFHAHDVNKDNVMTMEDADIFSENFSRHHKYEGAKAEQVKHDARVYWKEWLLQGCTEADEQTFVANMEKAYLADKAKFRQELQRLFGLVMDIIDVNKDKRISEQEFMVMAKSTKFENFDEKYMKGFPQATPGYISIDDYVEAFVEFNCNEDINNIGKERPIHYGMGIVDLEKQ